MCTLGAVKLGHFILLKTRDPVPTMKFEDGVKKVSNKIKKLLVANEDGCYAGLNEFGVGIICSVVCVEGKLSKEFIGDLMPDLLEAKNAKEAVEMVESIKKPMIGNLIITDENECFVIEYYNGQTSITKIGDRDARTNHFIKLEVGPKTKEDYPSSFMRFERAVELLNQVKTREDVKRILSDHKNGPSTDSICRHGKVFTGSAFILDTKDKEILHCKGHPCSSTFKSYKFDLVKRCSNSQHLKIR